MDKQYIKKSKKLTKNLTRTVELDATDVKVSHDLILPTEVPSRPVNGSTYFDTDDHKITVYYDGQWYAL